MKRIALILLIIGSVLLVGAGKYEHYTDNQKIKMTVDTLASDGDSTSIDSTYTIGNTYHYKSVMARIYLDDAGSEYATGSGGVGEADSAILWLYTTFDGRQTLIDSAIGAAIPCSLIAWLPDDIGDTILGDALQIRVMIYDSIHDTLADGELGVTNYNLHYKIKLK